MAAVLPQLPVPPPPPPPLPPIPVHQCVADEVNADNPVHVVPYIKSIYDHYYSLEKGVCVDTMAQVQGKSHAQMSKVRRSTLEWLATAAEASKVSPETLFLSMNIFDRFLQVHRMTPASKIQLAAVTALFIAAKYEEIYAPESSDMVRVAGNSISVRELCAMECAILSRLEYRLSVPTPYTFFRRFIVATRSLGGNKRHELAGRYVLERAIVEYVPSVIAAATTFILLTMEEEGWDSDMITVTKYTIEDLLPCAQTILRIIHVCTGPVYKKYASAKYNGVSKLPFPTTVSKDT